MCKRGNETKACFTETYLWNLRSGVGSAYRVAALHSKEEYEYFTMNSDDGDLENQAELEEKTRLINQVLELQHTLEDLSARVDGVKEENLKLKSENQVLGQYIENLMSASSVFQTTDTRNKRSKWKGSRRATHPPPPHNPTPTHTTPGPTPSLYLFWHLLRAATSCSGGIIPSLGVTDWPR